MAPFFLRKNRENKMAANQGSQRKKWVQSLDVGLSLEQRNKINRLKYYGQKNQKEWMKSLIGQKFVLNLNLDRHNK